MGEVDPGERLQKNQREARSFREGVVRRGKRPLGVPNKQEIAMSHDSPFIIRQLGTGDIEVFRRLLDTFGEVFEDVDTYGRAQPRDAYVEGLLCSDHFIALAALQDGAVIGGLAAYELKKFERERKEMYIYDLAVAVQQRRRGIATGLITQLKTIAKARGAYVIFVQADLNDPAAIALYTKLGTREDVLHFDIAVP
jgi:aminoglycoside 3-N-acetyltransferase I